MTVEDDMLAIKATRLTTPTAPAASDAKCQCACASNSAARQEIVTRAYHLPRHTALEQVTASLDQSAATPALPEATPSTSTPATPTPAEWVTTLTVRIPKAAAPSMCLCCFPSFRSGLTACLCMSFVSQA